MTTSSPGLFVFIVALLVSTAWMMLTNKTTEQERDEMLRDEEMWP